MKKEIEMELKRQEQETKIRGLIADLEIKRSAVRDEIRDLEEKRPKVYAEVVMKRKKAEERSSLDKRLKDLLQQRERHELSLQGLREMLKDLSGADEGIKGLQRDRERYEELKRYVIAGQSIRETFERDVKTFGEQKAMRQLSAFFEKIGHLKATENYLEEMEALAVRLDDLDDYFEFTKESFVHELVQ